MHWDEVGQWLQMNKRLLLLCAVGGVLSVTLWSGDSPAAQSVKLKDDAPLKTTLPEKAAKPLMPEGYQAKVALRDPFSKAGQSAVDEKDASPAIAQRALPGQAEKVPASQPLLLGVASGNGRSLAIVRLRGESKVLASGERIGEYQLLEATENSALLQGPGGTLRLQRKGEER
ncbi:hypothetical protein [Azotosporobacter soli]|uniref:hypothetical protein n=1 Tax=Azotosporobacter soli TaxID=3055040 RepID=UPI0031FE99E4